MESPQVLVLAGRLVYKAHLTGRVPGPLFTHPAVSSDITIYSAPALEKNVLRLDQVTVETASSNLLFKLGAERFRDRVVMEIEQEVRYNLTPLLESAKSKINSRCRSNGVSDASEPSLGV